MEYIFLHFFLYKKLLRSLSNYKKRISSKYNLKQSIIIFSSIAHDAFNILTADMVNDPSHTHRKNPKLALPSSKSQDTFSDTLNPFSDNQTPSINNTNGITSPPTFYTIRLNEFRLTRLKLFPKRSPLSQLTFIYRTSVLPSSQEQNPLYLNTLSPVQVNMTIIYIKMTNIHINMTI